MSPQKSKQQQTAALAQGARVLSEEDHELIMEELHARDMERTRSEPASAPERVRRARRR